jgi:hypothetical protein
MLMVLLIRRVMRLSITYSILENYSFLSLNESTLTVYDTVGLHTIKVLVSFVYGGETYYGNFSIDISPNISSKSLDYTQSSLQYKTLEVGDNYIYSIYSVDSKTNSKTITINTSSTQNNDSITASKLTVSYAIAKIYDRD